MFVKVGDREFRVQFVHSAHDLRTSQGRELVPGGARQLIDNLAASLRRRVSFAEIGSVERFPGAMGEPLTGYTPLAQGFAVCHYVDQFNKREGRERALFRAIRVSGLDAATQDELAFAAVGMSVNDLKVTIRHRTDLAHALADLDVTF